ncbi:Lrp/AsnC family transcriptional regulator [Pseudopelagicola sp. nBUS_19]|uniref:Lrp/AsnC family transcriptional regulator n=1 Tax=unclassified Pseudopelagicola TaxID=2649563 RepID=UPI003EC0DF62
MLNHTDRQLLSALQKNAHLTAQELSEILNLSPSQIGRRRHRLEADGYIQGYFARLDPDKVGLSVQAFIQVQLETHGPEQARSFSTLVSTCSEVVSAWALTGDADYLLRAYCADLHELNTLIHEIILPHPAVSRVQSQIVMDQLKRDAPLPT